MSSIYGEKLKISIFGQSHSAGVGVVVDGLPAGEAVDLEALGRFMARRAPGQSQLTTARKEADAFRVLSGLAEGTTCGAPFCAVIENTNVRKSDYAALADTPRPGHADYPAQVRHGGAQDKSGGGHFSARLTAPLCLAGGVALQLLARRGVGVYARIAAIAGVRDADWDSACPDAAPWAALAGKPLPVFSDEAGQQMTRAILDARAEEDSVGGVVECAAFGLPAGVGDPLFDGLENRIARAVFAIPAVKGVEFGAGFAAALLRGSENNDPFYFDETGAVRTETNRHGGILGGLSTGMPLVFRAAFKPTPSIGRVQRSVDLAKRTNVEMRVAGRHDPCVVPRAVPCVEAAAALALLDSLL